MYRPQELDVAGTFCLVSLFPLFLFSYCVV